LRRKERDKKEKGKRKKEKEGRQLRNCPVGNFRKEPDCRGGKR
jgi:hypothetical protein